MISEKRKQFTIFRLNVLQCRWKSYIYIYIISFLENSSTFMTDLQTTTERMQLENNTFMWIIFGTVFGTSVLLIVFLLMFIYYRKSKTFSNLSYNIA